MIKANELRIGNIVNSLTSGGWKLAYVDIEMLKLLPRQNDPFEYMGIRPVPLTTEILYNSGFEVYHDNPRLEFFYVNKAGYYPFFIYSDREGNFYHNENLELKYLHQLQNLFFALTGSELPVSL